MRGALFLGLVLAALLGTGCQTAIGNYFANRGRDLGQIACLEVGGGLGFGAGVRASGLLHYGIGGGVSESDWVLGWEYGHGCAFGRHTGPSNDEVIEVWLPVPYPWVAGHAAIFPHMATTRGRHGYKGNVNCACFSGLPALTTGLNTPDPWPIVHSYDVEVSVWLGLLYLRVGVSPGEILDFILGWFGLDIASDDKAWKPPPPPE